LDYNHVWSLFGSHLYNPSDSHVAFMSVHIIVQPVGASCWPTICGGKSMKRPSVLKITQNHTNNWEVGILFTQCTVSPPIDVP
jgi:hypothetical protein